MRIMVLGSGGREHALVWKLAQSAEVEALFAAPGNPGMAPLATLVPLKVNDFEQVKQALLDNQIDTLVVGPEDPLVNGIADFCANDSLLQKVNVIGPSAKGAQLEGSKDFAKQFLKRHHIPTAGYETFTAAQYAQACAFLDTLQPPYVLKADGLAAGKGVLIPLTLDQAKSDLKELMGGKFGDAGNKVVIEEFLKGIEVSVFVLTDGKNYKILPEAKDYKRIGEHDTGLNTGGMGAVSPVSFVNKEFMDKVEDRIIKPTIDGLAQEQISYKGFIFLGLMNCQGDPYVIEYNVRMGDPETEVVMMRLEGDLAEAFAAVGKGTLDRVPLCAGKHAAVTVVGVSGGYPESYPKGKIITGADSLTEGTLFHMGTSLKDGNLVTSGGRVLALSAMAATPLEARVKAYEQLKKLSFEGLYYRKDIGLDLL